MGNPQGRFFLLKRITLNDYHGENIIMIKEIENFTGYYIEDNGTVWCNLGKGCRNKDKRKDFYSLKSRKLPNGYLRVYMRRDSDNKRVDMYIHRLVAIAFIPNPENKKFVNHIDTNRENNSVDNLEWCTSKENNQHSINLGHLCRNESNGRFYSGLDNNI